MNEAMAITRVVVLYIFVFICEHFFPPLRADHVMKKLPRRRRQMMVEMFLTYTSKASEAAPTGMMRVMKARNAATIMIPKPRYSEMALRKTLPPLPKT